MGDTIIGLYVTGVTVTAILLTVNARRMVAETAKYALAFMLLCLVWPVALVWRLRESRVVDWAISRRRVLFSAGAAYVGVGRPNHPHMFDTRGRWRSLHWGWRTDTGGTP